MPGHIIRKYREMRNYTQSYVASKLGISQNAYSKIENNITQLTVHHVKELSRLFEIPVTDLLNDEFEIHKPVSLPKVVTKTDLMQHLQQLQQKLQSKHVARHDSYLVALSLIIAAEQSISTVH